MDRNSRDYALKKMQEVKKYAAGGSAKVRKEVATKEGSAIKKKKGK